MNKNIKKRVYCFIWKMEIGSIACQVKSGFLEETHLDILKLGHSALTTTAVYLRMSGQEAKGDTEGKGVGARLCVAKLERRSST